MREAIWQLCTSSQQTFPLVRSRSSFRRELKPSCRAIITPTPSLCDGAVAASPLGSMVTGIHRKPKNPSWSGAVKPVHVASRRPTSGCTGREPLRYRLPSSILLRVAVRAGEPQERWAAEGTMLVEARIQGSTLRVDVAKTASFYKDSAVVRNSCSCLYCRNFRAAIDSEQGTE